MVKILLDLQQFLLTCLPLFTTLAVFTLFAVLCAKSIKKHATAYYVAFSIPFILQAVPTVLRWCGVELGFSFMRVPILAQILRDYIHMGTFGHPLLIIIMYMGALDAKRPAVKKLMSIRKELSIISGFPVLTHSLVRVANNFPSSLRYFTDHDAYMETARVGSELGAGISSFAMVLGILLLALFLPLWITSFDSVHKRMGGAKWKKLQKWSYVLYAMLFIHAMGIQVGGMLNPRGGHAAPAPVVAQAVAAPAASAPESHPRGEGGQRPEGGAQRGEGRPEGGGNAVQGANAAQNAQNAQPAAQPAGRGQGTQQAAPASGGRAQTKSLADLSVSAPARRWIHVVSLLLIYGSYLVLRVRKARKKAAKKAAA